MSSSSRTRTIGRIVPNGRLAWIALAVSAVLVGSSATALATAFDDGLPDGVVLRVGDRTITESQLETRLESLKALYGVKEPTDAAERDQFLRDAAKSLAMSILLDREAGRRDIVVAQKQADAELAKIVSERLGGDRDSFVRYLGTAGVSEDQVLDEIKRTIATSRLYAAITEDVPDATTAQAQAEYDARKAEMTTPEKRRISNIVVESRADADRVVAALADPAKFAVVARRDSLDQSTKDQGGDLGTHAASEMEPSFADAAFAAEPGAVFGPVQTQYGWNVGLVTKVVPGDPLTFKQVQATLLQALTSRAQLTVWRAWLGELLKSSDVEYADGFRPESPTDLPSDTATTTPDGEE